MKNPWVILGVVVAVLLGGSIGYSSQASEQNNEGVEVQTQVKGNPDATTVLVEFSDFQCPACASFQPVLSDLMEQYGDQIRLEYKHFPLVMAHQHAQRAALAAEAAGQQGAFFEYHDLLFENQQTWSSSPNPSAIFVGYAEELGLDTETFRRHSNASLLRDKVRADMAEGNERGVTGTPTFFLNGQRMQFQTFQEFFDAVASAADPNYGAALEATVGTSSEATPTDGTTAAPTNDSSVRFGL